jgi:hypothetical protein
MKQCARRPEAIGLQGRKFMKKKWTRDIVTKAGVKFSDVKDLR